MNQDLNFELMTKEELIEFAKRMVGGGITLSFYGKRTAQVIERKVMPRVVRVNQALSYNAHLSNNIMIEGENLQGMVTLYKYRGQVDLILTDPPYNTGKDFRYNDRWDTDPNDPDLGNLVALEDGSRHTKWIKFMLPRLQMMKRMLKPGGVLAICIDEREFYHLGLLLNETFGEENRIGIINWQKAYAPKNDSTHISTATEYVLVYAKDKENAKTNLMVREDKTNQKYKNPDNDPYGIWREDNPTAATPAERDRYAIQSPFTGSLHYPGARAWSNKKASMKQWLEGWGSSYIEKDLKDGRPKALVIADAPVPINVGAQDLDRNPEVGDPAIYGHPAIAVARAKAEAILKSGVLPKLLFLKDGTGRPAIKRYLNDVRKGITPLTYWAGDDYDEPFYLGNQSWGYEESGHSQTGINELDYIMGKGHGFQTVKPLKLVEKIIQLWCPPDGLILDPFAGSGTTAHAVLNLNRDPQSRRSFILIEKGETGDDYTKTLTRERIKRAITGERIDKDGSLRRLEEPCDGGFAYWELEREVDAQTILAMKREELIDVVLTSHWEDEGNKATRIIERFDKPYKYLVGKNKLNQGFFIIWNGKDSVGELNEETYMDMLREAKLEHVQTPFHVYARFQVYQSNKVRFNQIPDKILLNLGLSENSDRFNNEES